MVCSPSSTRLLPTGLPPASCPPHSGLQVFGFTALVELLSSSLRPAGKLLSLAVPPREVSAYGTQRCCSRQLLLLTRGIFLPRLQRPSNHCPSP